MTKIPTYNYNNDINPQGYIYQHDDARIQVKLSVDDDLPNSKKVGTNTYYGYTTNNIIIKNK